MHMKILPTNALHDLLDCVIDMKTVLNTRYGAVKERILHLDGFRIQLYFYKRPTTRSVMDYYCGGKILPPQYVINYPIKVR